MSKKRKDRAKRNTRDRLKVANANALGFRRVLRPVFSLSEISDNRDWRPDEPVPQTRIGTPARVVRSSKRNINHSDVKSELSTTSLSVERQRFVEPWQVITCLRRKIRKEVLFARRKVGKGKRVAKPRWSELSYVRC